MTALRASAAALVLLIAWLMLGVPALGFIVSFYPEPAFIRPTAHLRDEAGVRSCGSSRRERIGDAEDGVWFMRLEGDAAEIGWASGVLCGDLSRTLETELFTTAETLVPQWWARHLLFGVVGLNNRTLPEYLLPEERVEIAASGAGSIATWGPDLLGQPHYPRAVQYHALHDISHYLIDNPLVQAPSIGCTAVAVRGRRVEGGGLLVGRLFDFEGGCSFDRDKVVQLVRPRGGLAFLSVSWAGAAGVVTGLNEAGLWISLNAGASDGRRWVGRPTILAAREVLATCRTLADAVTLLERTPVFVSESILLASGDEGEAVVLELGPTGHALRPMVDDQIIVTNHFLAPAWSADATNAARIRDGTSVRRYARAEALLGAGGSKRPVDLLELLRDRRGADDADLGFGNRGTINAWIGAHLVVADLVGRRIWVCGTPHSLGSAWACGFTGPLADATLPASVDRSEYFSHAERWLALCRTAQTLLAVGRRSEAALAAAAAHELNPRHYLSEILLGESSDDPSVRRQHGQRALELQPAYANERKRSERLLDPP